MTAGTALAVRTHVPVRIGFDTVLVPLADADQIMRDIARSAWPGEPSPLEEQGHTAAVETIAGAVTPPLVSLARWIDRQGIRNGPEKDAALDVLADAVLRLARYAVIPDAAGRLPW